MFNILKPRWLTVLTGVAACMLMCTYTTNVSWAAMCMVGYDTSACEGVGGTGNPDPDPDDDCEGDDCSERCPNVGKIGTDCQRHGFSEPSAVSWFVNHEDVLPAAALKAPDKWECEACENSKGKVHDKACYARWRCYKKCENENKATNKNGGTGKIPGWTGSYSEQFVHSQADCNAIYGFEESIYGEMVPAKRYFQITKNICGYCDRPLCDGAEVTEGCYEPCEDKYQLESGTRCCNKLDELEKMNPYSGDPNYWYPYTSPLYHTSGCYDTETRLTAIGDFDNLSDSDPRKYCYHQVPKDCGKCRFADEGQNCDCVPKTCEQFATEKGYQYGLAEGKVVDLSTQTLHNGNVKIGNTCYVPAEIINSDCTADTEEQGAHQCALLAPLHCPNGEPDSDCSCGVGCPIDTATGIQTIPESEYTSNTDYINGAAIQEDKLFCIELSNDNTTCQTWSKCYVYNECSDIGDFLVPDGNGGCKCGAYDSNSERYWKAEEEKDDCDFDVSAKTPKKSNAVGFHKHDTTTWVGEDKIVCYLFDGVTCPGVLAKGPVLESNGICKCYCTGDYTDSSLNTTYNGYSDWTATRVSPDDYDSYPNCIIDGSEMSEKQGWEDNTNTPFNTTCYRYNRIDCKAADSRLEQDGCDCICPSEYPSSFDPNNDKGAEQFDDNGNCVVYSDNRNNCKPGDDPDHKISYDYDIDTSYIGTDGESHPVRCWSKRVENCFGDKIKFEINGKIECLDCSDLIARDNEFSGDWTTDNSKGSCNCGKVEWSKTYTGVDSSKTCTKCDNASTAKDCPSGYYTTNTTPIQKTGTTDTWVCSVEDAGCIAWDTEGNEVYCYNGTDEKTDTCPKKANGSIATGYRKDDCGTQVPKNHCYFHCEEYHTCETNDKCPTNTSCAAGLTPQQSTKQNCRDQGFIYCINSSGEYCDSPSTCNTKEETNEYYGESF